MPGPHLDAFAVALVASAAGLSCLQAQTPGRSCEEVARESCEWKARCDAPSFGHWFTGVDDCVRRVDPNCEAAQALPGASVTAAQRQACLDAWAAADCGTLEIPECVFAGTLIEGANCVRPEQCRSGFCRPIENFNCGTCATGPLVREFCFALNCVIEERPGLGTGVACELPDSCGPGLYCHCAEGRDGGVCEEELMVGENEDCGPQPDGTVRGCSGGTWCFSAVCQRAIGGGKPCSASGQCEYGLRCIESVCRLPVLSVCR